MRTSNKILIGLLLGVIVLFTAHFVSISAAIRNKQLINVDEKRVERFDHFTYKDVKQVSISGLYRVSIYPSDTLRVEIDKRGKDEIQCKLSGNTLTVEAIANKAANTGAYESGREVNLYLPPVDSIRVRRSELWVFGSKDASHAPSYNLYLEHTGLNRRDHRYVNADSLYYGHFRITSKESNIEFPPISSVRDIEMDLTNSNFNDGQGSQFNTLRILADSNSNVTLRGSSLKKAQLISKE